MNTLNARYGHTNLVARDWRSLAAFYEEHFGCVPVPPERDYRGPDLEAGTGVPGAALQGAHLRLPGHGPNGPTWRSTSTSPSWRACRRSSIGPVSGTSPSWSTTCRRRARRCSPPPVAQSARW